MAANIISILGTAVTIFTAIKDGFPDPPAGAKVKYIIANDDPDGTGLTSAGGDLPDLRMWDETIEFLGGSYDPGNCPEGYTTCTTEVDTQEAVTYTLFTGNDDAICIAWTGMSWAGGQKKYGFHPGNWAHGCDAGGYDGDMQHGVWYYAGIPVPGIPNPDDVYCAWVDKNGDIETTGFQVHWPEFDSDRSDKKSLDYYCTNSEAVNFRTEYDPNDVIYYTRKRNMFADHPSMGMSPAPDATATNRQVKRISSRFAEKGRIIKSFYAKHKASELCDHSLHAAGPSFVSYEEKQFCYMPTKTLYPFCGEADSGLCWDDESNIVVSKDGTSRAAIPDLSHINKTVVWGKE